MLVKHEFNCEFIGEFNPFSFLLIAIWGHFNAPHRGSTPLGGSVVNPFIVGAYELRKSSMNLIVNLLVDLFLPLR